MQRNEKLCADDAFYDLYSSCVGCIEDDVNSGSPREYVEPNLGRPWELHRPLRPLLLARKPLRLRKQMAHLWMKRALLVELEQLETSVAGTTNSQFERPQLDT